MRLPSKVLVAITAVAIGTSALAQPVYRLTDLGTFDGISSAGAAFNSSGKATGSATNYLGQSRAFLWDGSLMEDLGALGGNTSTGNDINESGHVTGFASFTPLDTGAYAFIWDGDQMRSLGGLSIRSSYGEAINASGKVAGWAYTVDYNTWHAFVWDGTRMIDLGTLGGINSGASDINDAGQVTGTATLSGRTGGHAFLWDGTNMRDLGTLGGEYSQARAINASGQVTGMAYLPSGMGHAFLWDGAVMRDLGTLGGYESVGVAINALGQVAGRSTTGNVSPVVWHAFIWDGAHLRDLGALGGNSESRAINDAGQVVGYAWTTGSSTYRAFLWDGSTLHDLNTLVDTDDPLKPYVTLRDGTAINNAGQILVQGIDSRTGQEHAYIATPVPQDATPPVIQPSLAGTLGANGWYLGNVALTWTVSDPESTISSSTGCGQSSVATDTVGQTFTCSATSGGGTSTESVTIKRDATPPTGAFSISPPANQYGWWNQSVTITMSGTDATSGVWQCNESVVITTEQSGQAILGHCYDNAGNRSAGDSTGPINIDKTAPTITIVSPSNGATYKRKQQVIASFSCADALSGSATCAGTVASGQPIDTTSKVGTATFTVTAADKAGNPATRSVTYRVK